MNILGMSFNISDNSGATKLLCIGTLNKNIKIKTGIIIIGVIKKIKSHSKIKLSTITKALIIRTKNSIIDYLGTIYKFNSTDVILLDRYNNPIGTRIFGMISYKNLNNNLLKLKNLTTSII